ncbi:MAG TPA: phosphoesterase, partial [Acidimicrobiia bacterium]
MRKSVVALATAIALLPLAAPARATADLNPVVRWNRILLHTIRDTRTPPTVASRALAVLHTCIYDAWAAYDPVAEGTRLGGALRRPADERTLDAKRE